VVRIPVVVSGSALVPLLLAERRYGFDLPARPESVGLARQLLRRRLAEWDLSEDVVDTAALVISELFTNAVVHACGDRVLGSVSLGEATEGPTTVGGTATLRIAVQDRGSASDGPQLCRSPRGEHGRGLLLVDAVSTAWGVESADHVPGRTVWAELPC
jgi:anti-sigma regulatory factor (Ser/Thr protein kinase)